MQIIGNSQDTLESQSSRNPKCISMCALHTSGEAMQFSCNLLRSVNRCCIGPGYIDAWNLFTDMMKWACSHTHTRHSKHTHTHTHTHTCLFHTCTVACFHFHLIIISSSSSLTSSSSSCASGGISPHVRATKASRECDETITRLDITFGGSYREPFSKVGSGGGSCLRPVCSASVIMRDCHLSPTQPSYLYPSPYVTSRATSSGARGWAWNTCIIIGRRTDGRRRRVRWWRWW